VISRAGVESTPNCATLRPADEANELHTILLAGPIADPADLPAYVVIVGPVEDVRGKVLEGEVSPPVTIGVASGPSLVHAFVLNKPDGPPGSSRRVIQMVWQGGVTGPNGVEVGTDQLTAIRIIDCNGIVPGDAPPSAHPLCQGFAFTGECFNTFVPSLDGRISFAVLGGNSIAIQNEGFENLVRGSAVTMDEVLRRAPENWYIEAQEAKALGLVAGVL
jgi:hypothetical protein